MLKLDRRAVQNVLIIFLISVGVKLYAAQLLVWEVDYVPVIARGQAWLDGGTFPAVGTLSSVAAYNMPFLTWLQLPVMLFTRDVATILIVTQLIFNFIATWFVFRLGAEMFTSMAGFIAAMLFTLSETGISSAYTAWAQLLLPGFYVMVLYCLYRWKVDNRAVHVAFALIVSTAAFMTHFSAVLLYGIIVAFWLILRLPLNWRGIIVGLFVSALMLTPYMLFQVERDFVDLKAFFTRQTTIEQSVLDEYAYLKPENQNRATPSVDTRDSPTDTSPLAEPKAPTSRIERGISWVLSIPLQVIEGMRLVFNTDLQSLRQYYPVFHMMSQILRGLLEIAFWGGIVYALYGYVDGLRTQYHNLSSDERLLKHRLKLAINTLIDTSTGRNLILLLFVLGIIAGLIIVRAAPNQQSTYYTGLFSIQFVMCAYGIASLMDMRNYGRRLLLLVIVLVGLGAMDRVVRVANHDPNSYSPFNVALYRSIDQATEWIATDWGDDDGIVVSYDVMPEMAVQWWIAPWNTVDETYRIGMAYDYLLSTYYGLENMNINPIGLAENPDYIVTYDSGLDRYPLDQFNIQQIGALYILTPKRL